MREQAKRQAGRGKIDDAGSVLEKSWDMAGVGVAKRAEFFVITADKSGTGSNAFTDFKDLLIQAGAELRHRFRFVDIGRGKKL